MAPLPKRRFSHSRKSKRFAKAKSELSKTNKCQNCGSQKLPHRACPQCHKK